LLTGPEPTSGISAGTAKKVVMDWANRSHKNTVNSKQDLNKQMDSYKDLVSKETRNC
jgi:hypothetical protein